MIKLSKCRISSIFAYLALIYIFASIYYMLITRKFGTPFKDALQQYPELLKIKKDSIQKRSKTFYTGIVIGFVLLFIIKQFGNCW